MVSMLTYLCTYDATYHCGKYRHFLWFDRRDYSYFQCLLIGGQAIKNGTYESIKYGLIPMMLAGGGEEFCPSEVYVFDSLYAASRNNDNPSHTPRPYDKARDGLVIGEGGCMFVLEGLSMH